MGLDKGDGLMDWDRIEAWGYTILGLFFILGFVLQSLPVILTVMVLALVLLWIKNDRKKERHKESGFLRCKKTLNLSWCF